MRKLALTLVLLFVFYPLSGQAATDIKNDAALGSNLTTAWFGSSEAVEVDLTSNGNTLTNVNTVLSGTSPNTGETTADFEYSSSEYFTRADTADISFTSAFSFAMWINFESYGTGGQTPMLLRKYGAAGSQDYIMEWGVSGTTLTPRFQYFDGTTYRDASASAGSTINAGTWYHMCITFDAGSVIYYINGSKLGNTMSVGGTAIADGAGTLYVSSTNGSGQYIDGQVHQLLFYDKVLTSTDCSDLYNAGTELPFEAAGAEPEATTFPATAVHGSTAVTGATIIQ